MTEFRRAIWDICAGNAPLSARQCYYRAVVAGLVAKDTGKSRASEKQVGGALDVMREDYVATFGPRQIQLTERAVALCRELLLLPFEWVTDNTRTRYQARLYGDSEDALADLARTYRRNLWRLQPRHVEVWCESDSIGGVLLNLTDRYGVALLPCKGQSSKRFIWDSAQAYARLGKPVTCLYVGDFDPSGLDIGNSVQERLARYSAPDVEFRRIAITPDQVRDMGLPGHGLNPNHPASVRRRFIDVCDDYGISGEAVEAEAMPPGDLRDLVEDAIREYIDQRQWELELAVEAEERAGLERLTGHAP